MWGWEREEGGVWGEQEALDAPRFCLTRREDAGPSYSFDVHNVQCCLEDGISEAVAGELKVSS
eukprot:2298544-Rhodomonas_salina.3